MEVKQEDFRLYQYLKIVFDPPSEIIANVYEGASN